MTQLPAQQSKTDTLITDGPQMVNQMKKSDVPEGLWMRCPECEAMLYRKEVERNLHVLSWV